MIWFLNKGALNKESQNSMNKTLAGVEQDFKIE